MHFHTELNPEKLSQSIRLNERVITLGSCFADAMGRQLADHKLEVLNNPFGTIYNPVSIANVLSMALNGTAPDPDLYVEREGVWFHYDFHSSFWAHSREELQERLLEQLTQVGDALRQADWLLLTLGTAWVYRHQETGKIVANCHKMPGFLFDKYLYMYEHTVDALTKALKQLKRANPALKVLMTVSPVRHTKDTLPMNQVSKSLLRLATHELTQWNDDVHYFPAYELMVDDLRDYRFYEADLIHPNAVAEAYIFQKFAESTFDDELRTFITEWQGIRKSLTHRPFHERSESYQRFLENLLKKLESMVPKIDVSAEKADVQRRLSAFRSVDPGAHQAA